MFSKTKSLKQIDLPATIEEIRDYAFYESSLEKIVIPDGIQKINAYGVGRNTSLKDIHIPNSVTTFGNYILRYSINVEEITMPGHVRLVTLFYSTTATNMSKKITKVNVATGSTYVIANFLNGITHIKIGRAHV